MPADWLRLHCDNLTTLKMFRFKLLPWEYGVRNLLRRPSRSTLTLGALTVVITLVFVVVGFVRGLEQSLAVSGDPDAVLVYSINTAENIENSAITAQVPGLLTASLKNVQRRYGQPHVSGELYLGTKVGFDKVEGEGELGLVRGVTASAPLVRRQLRIVAGHWPGPGEILVGKLAPAKLGVDASRLDIGQTLRFERRIWKVSGLFTAGGSALESELWCRLPDLQQALKRQDLSVVALLMSPGANAADVTLFCKERIDLELQALSETEYYASLQKHYKPVRTLAWLVVLLVAGAGVFAGLNMMYGAVAGRVREIATLQAIGYRRRSILISLIQEGVLLAASASLLAGIVSLVSLNGMAVRFTMGAFALRIDSMAVLVGSATGLALGIVGALPPAVKALRSPVVEGLKSI